MKTVTRQPEVAEELKQTSSSSTFRLQLDSSQSKQKLFLGVIPEKRMALYIILVLIIAPPIGVILMWFLTRWPLWMKVFVSLVIFGPIAFVMWVASHVS